MTRLRVVLLGTSFARRVQAVAFGRHPGFEIAGIAGSDPARTAAAAEELGVPAHSTDWRGLLERVKPDLAAVSR